MGKYVTSPPAQHRRYEPVRSPTRKLLVEGRTKQREWRDERGNGVKATTGAGDRRVAHVHAWGRTVGSHEPQRVSAARTCNEAYATSVLPNRALPYEGLHGGVKNPSVVGLPVA
jgi:single-stranded DNA-binding protein